MSISPADMMTLPIAMALGLLFGMGPCLVGCLPYLGPVFLSLDGGVRRSWEILLPVSLGRLSAYTGFGLAAGIAGHVAGHAADPKAVGLVLGFGALSTGLGLLLHRQRKGRSACLAGTNAIGQTLPGGLFLLGFAMALSPCAPLTAVLLAAAASGSPQGGAGLGLAFGFGALLVPSLVYGAGFSYAAQQLRDRLGRAKRYAELASALLFIATGLFNLIRWGI